MAARGRGGGFRGRGRGIPVAFMNKETQDMLAAHGIGRIDNVPPPVYDLLKFTKPQPLIDNSDQDFLVKKRQLFREAAKCLPYFVEVKARKKEVECYSDKYEKDRCSPLQPDWSRLPSELSTSYKRRKRKGGTSAKKSTLLSDISHQLEDLEKNEITEETEELPDNKAEKKKDVDGADDEDDQTIDEDDYDEQDHEEDNDYAANYFESDESRGADGDDNDDETYYS